MNPVLSVILSTLGGFYNAVLLVWFAFATAAMLVIGALMYFWPMTVGIAVTRELLDQAQVRGHMLWVPWAKPYPRRNWSLRKRAK